jgi:Phytanoyl-CoA dioxygenase (PhyH)
VLSEEEISAFMTDGYVTIRGAIPVEVAGACRDVVWSELEQRGIRRNDRSTWTAPVVRVSCPGGGPFIDAGAAPLVREARDQLLGPGRWMRHDGIGGTVPVRFPSEDNPGDIGWHLDGGFQPDEGGLRLNIRSRSMGMLTLYLLSDVDEHNAPTRLRPGSHADAARVLAAADDNGIEWLEASREADVASAHRPTALATGQAGDVFLCHPFLVHTASWPHRGQSPRFMAQPSVTLLGEFPLHTLKATPSPTEQAVLDALA